ncbi:hypothetical protein LguiA_004142 [Lonicera macranthoides]
MYKVCEQSPAAITCKANLWPSASLVTTTYTLLTPSPATTSASRSSPLTTPMLS